MKHFLLTASAIAVAIALAAQFAKAAPTYRTLTPNEAHRLSSTSYLVNGIPVGKDIVARILVREPRAAVLQCRYAKCTKIGLKVEGRVTRAGK